MSTGNVFHILVSSPGKYKVSAGPLVAGNLPQFTGSSCSTQCATVQTDVTWQEHLFKVLKCERNIVCEVEIVHFEAVSWTAVCSV